MLKVELNINNDTIQDLLANVIRRVYLLINKAFKMCSDDLLNIPNVKEKASLSPVSMISITLFETIL